MGRGVDFGVSVVLSAGLEREGGGRGVFSDNGEIFPGYFLVSDLVGVVFCCSGYKSGRVCVCGRGCVHHTNEIKIGVCNLSVVSLFQKKTGWRWGLTKGVRVGKRWNKRSERASSPF